MQREKRMDMQRLGLSRTVSLAYAEAIEAVTAALKEEGFGILTEVDVKATLKKKIDVDFRPYVILGACNPTLAHRALSTEPQLGLLLPCNAIVYDNEDGTTTVSIMDPMLMASMSDNAELHAVAAEANGKLQRVIAKLA